VLALTGSPAQAGIVGFAQSLPFVLVGLPAGALVDRVDRKRLMLVSDGTRAIALATIPVAYAFDVLTVAQLAAVAFVEGAFFILFDFAETSSVPQIVEREQLPTAISVHQARVQGADLAGQPLGGVLFALHRMAPFVVDVVSYVVSFLALLFIRRPLQEAREGPARSLRSDIAEGIGWLWRQPFLRACVFLVAGSNFVGNALFLVLIVRAQELGASASVIGLMLGFYGAGSLLGSVLAPSVVRRVDSRHIVIGSLWVWALGTAVLALVEQPLVLGVVVALAGFPLIFWNVVLASYRYALVPDRLLGRVVSAGRFVAWSTIPLGALAGGLLAESLDGRAAILVLALLGGVVALAATAIPSVRHAPRVEELSAPAPAG
jgi:MFS family permease